MREKDLSTPDLHSDSPRVDVVIPVFNGERTIERAIRSVLDQGYPNLWVICVDDASNDQTAAVVESIISERLTLIRSTHNSGQSVARNRAIQQSDSRYLAFLDADDEALPGRILAQVEFLETHPRISVVGTQYIPTSSQIKSNFPLRHWEICSHLPFGNCIAMPTVMIRREDVIDAVGRSVFQELDQLGIEDYDLWLRLQKAGLRFANLTVAGILYDDNISPEAERLRASESAALRSQHFSWVNARCRLGEHRSAPTIRPLLRWLQSWSKFVLVRVILKFRLSRTSRFRSEP